MRILLYSPDNGVTRNFMPHLWMFLLHALTPPGHEVLLIDEALATGDAEFRVKSHARIQELRAEAGTVFLVAHNLEEIELTCNRVIWLERGKIVEQGEDVISVVDRYIAASGGQSVARDPVTRRRIKAEVGQPTAATS